jgi:hypothetical protein
MSVGCTENSENSSKGDTELIPIGCLLEIRLIARQQRQAIYKTVEKNGDEEGQAQIHNRPVHGV